MLGTLVATEILFELGLWVPRACSGIYLYVCVYVQKKVQQYYLNEEKVVWVQTSRHKEICCCLNVF